jgi:hypothetical protein
MSRTKTSKKCEYNGCKNLKKLHSNGNIHSSFCSTHQHKATINSFVCKTYEKMKQRISGRGTRRPDLYVGKILLPRDIFVVWAKNHPDFLSLYKRYIMSDFDRRLAPSVNRIHSDKGYTLDNMEWVTSSQNSSLAGTVRKMNNKQKKVIYAVLGVKR